jgi:PadR family transcriptional regulator PadR
MSDKIVKKGRSSQMKKLTINEQIFLIAIWHLKDQAYGIKIRERIIELTGSSMVFGALYNTLDYLVKKGYIEAKKKDPEQDSQNRKRVYYTITKEGIEALQAARKLQNDLWKNIPDFSAK